MTHTRRKWSWLRSSMHFSWFITKTNLNQNSTPKAKQRLSLTEENVERLMRDWRC